MIGVLIFSHGGLCTALRIEAERLTGARPSVHCLSMQEGEAMEALEARVDNALNTLDTGEGVIVFCDVVGGTPWNVCGRLQRRGQHQLRRLGGVGMPVIVKALMDHGEHENVDAWVEELVKYAADRVRAG